MISTEFDRAGGVGRRLAIVVGEAATASVTTRTILMRTATLRVGQQAGQEALIGSRRASRTVILNVVRDRLPQHGAHLRAESPVFADDHDLARRFALRLEPIRWPRKRAPSSAAISTTPTPTTTTCMLDDATARLEQVERGGEFPCDKRSLPG